MPWKSQIVEQMSSESLEWPINSRDGHQGSPFRLRKLSSKNVKFIWTEDLQKELDGLKAKMREHINISPVDVNKEIHAHIDVAQTFFASLAQMTRQMAKP